MTDTSLLPPSATTQEVSIATAISRVSDVPIPNADLYNPALCPASMLPWLAWAFDVDAWNPAWTDAQKRLAISNSVFVHRHKGTRGAVTTALEAFGLHIDTIEWQQKTPIGAPYTFGMLVTITDVGIPDPATYDQIISVVTNTKNVRSKITGLDVLGLSTGNVYFGGVVISGETVTIKSE